MDSNNSSKTAILATLIYSDNFDYPLTGKQLWRYLHTDHTISYGAFIKLLQGKKNKIAKKNGFYFLSGKAHLVQKRKSLLATNKEKIRKAKHVAKLLSRIPTICFIGISGSVAMESALPEDDIDLFFITKRNTVWLTRLLVTLILDLKGLRRKRTDVAVRNKMCVNMYMDEAHLAFPKSQQNLYIAHEIVQVMPIFDKGEYYKKLLRANKWGEKYLYNGFSMRKYKISFSFPWTYALFPLEMVVRKFQLWYMKKHMRHEKLTNTFLAFHPTSYEGKILRAYKQKLKSYGL